MHTTASVFLNTLAQAGVTHAFVNWGNDHPAILEELERQRLQNGRTLIQIITCPNEMVALSAAQGFTQVTGVPSLVIVHVDVGTQVRSYVTCMLSLDVMVSCISSRHWLAPYTMWTAAAPPC